RRSLRHAPLQPHSKSGLERESIRAMSSLVQELHERNPGTPAQQTQLRRLWLPPGRVPATREEVRPRVLLQFPEEPVSVHRTLEPDQAARPGCGDSSNSAVRGDRGVCRPLRFPQDSQLPPDSSDGQSTPASRAILLLLYSSTLPSGHCCYYPMPDTGQPDSRRLPACS